MQKKRLATLLPRLFIIILFVACQGWGTSAMGDASDMARVDEIKNTLQSIYQPTYGVSGEIIDSLYNLQVTNQQNYDQCIAKCNSNYTVDSSDYHACDIKCKNGKLKDQVCANSQINAQYVGSIISPIQQAVSSRACENLTKWDDITEEGDFKVAGKKRVIECVVMEYDTADTTDDDCDFDDDGTDDCEKIGNLEYYDDGDNDGICDRKGGGTNTPNNPNQQDRLNKYDEWCMEDVDDGIGDDDGFCEYQGKGKTKYSEPCAQLCTEEMVEGDEENYNTNKFVAYEDMLDDASEDLTAANTAVAYLLQELMNVQETTRSLQEQMKAGGTPEECQNMVSAHTREPFMALMFTLEVAKVAQPALDICSNASSTVVVSGNVRFHCVALAIVNALTAAAWETSEFIDDTITSTRVDNTAICLEYLGEQVKLLQRGMVEANVKLDELLILMNLPQGQRPRFPEKECNLDGVCDSHESMETCPIDCSECGDGRITGYEQCEHDGGCLMNEMCVDCMCVE